MRHIGFSAAPNNTFPWLGVEKCTPRPNATPLHLIYKSVHSEHLIEKLSRPTVFEDIFKKFKECLCVYSLAQYIQIALNWSDHDLCKCIKEMGGGGVCVHNGFI